MGGCCSTSNEDFEIEEAKNMTELFNIMKARTSDQILTKKEVDLYMANPSYKPKLAEVKHHSIIELQEHSHFLQHLIEYFTKTCEFIQSNKETTLDKEMKNRVIKICQH